MQGPVEALFLFQKGNWMSVVMLLARVALAMVFALAGAAKLLDLKHSRAALSDFGLPTWLAGPLGTALPFFELSVSILILPTSTAWWGALEAAALLSAFVAGIAINLARGKRPDCNCFGQLHSEPIGSPTLARTGLLLLIAVGVLARASSDPGLSLAVLLSSPTCVEEAFARSPNVATQKCENEAVERFTGADRFGGYSISSVG